MINLAALPAVIALGFKLALFGYALKREAENGTRYSKDHSLRVRLFLLFLFSLSVQAVAEINFLTSETAIAAEPWGRLYFGASIFILVFLLQLTLLVGTGWHAGAAKAPRWAAVILYLPALILEALLWCTSLFVAGFEPMAYTYTKIPGPLFFLWEWFAIGHLCASALLLVYGARKQITALQRLRNKLMLIGLIPTIIIGVGVIVLQRFGFRAFNATATLPLALTFFIVTTAYATYQHRLVDVAFYVPWSKVRKRKSALYRRMRETVGEIAALRSLPDILDRVGDALRCQVVLLSGGGPQPAAATDAFIGSAPGAFPPKLLCEVDSMVVAEEIAASHPLLHRTMRRHRIGAIAPFRTGHASAPQWLLFGANFSDEVQTALDFKHVERLLDEIARRMRDDAAPARSAMVEALRAKHERQALAQRRREEREAAREHAALLRHERHVLHQANIEARREHAQVAVVPSNLPQTIATGKQTLQQYLDEFESELVLEALVLCRGDAVAAATRLGVSVETFEYLCTQYDLQPDFGDDDKDEDS